MRSTLIGFLATAMLAGALYADADVVTDANTRAAEIAAWERQAELCNQYLSKGQRVGVDGYFRSRTWEEDGKRRDAIEVVARSVQFLSPPSGDAGGEVVPFEAAVAS